MPAQYDFISATGGGVHSGGIVTWNLGGLDGMNGGVLANTIDSVRVVVQVRGDATGQARNRAAIWDGPTYHRTSNEFPNRQTAVMERNYVDILIDNPLSIEKTAHKPTVNPDDSLVYTIKVKNGEVDFLNGGRTGVRVAYANAGPGGGGALSTSVQQSQMRLKFRFYHDAHEPYINYNNYRVSYYLNQPGPPTWVYDEINREGLGLAPVTFSQQVLAPGPTWNHRFLIQFPDQIATITPFLYYYNSGGFGVGGGGIHQGATAPPRLTFDIHDAAYNNYSFYSDWSFDELAYAPDGDAYFPITNDWTDPDNFNVPVAQVAQNECGGPASHTVDNILVEEWDGYTWRRVYGDAPVSGREMQNVIIKDYLPAEVTFGGMISGPTPTVSVVGPQQVLTWPTLPGMLVGDSVEYRFWVRVDPESSFGGCPIAPGTTFENVAEATADNQPFVFDTVETTVTCDVILPTNTSFTKAVSSQNINQGDPVTYTLEYTNTLGSYFDDPLTSATTWTQQSGGASWSVAGGDVTLGNGAEVITSNYAHGGDGEINMNITTAQYAKFGVAFRHSGGALGNGQYLTFKHQNSGMEIQHWNGTTLVGGTTYTINGASFGYTTGSGNWTGDVRIVISGTQAQVWLGATSGAPLLTITGLTVGSGHAGLIDGDPAGNDNYGVEVIHSWNTHFDSAFDVDFSDPIPTGMSFTSASNGGVDNAGTVDWATIPGPVLAGAVLTRTWVATSTACSNDSIENIASLTFLGINELASAPALAASIKTYCANALPLTWLGLDGQIVSGGHLLEWRTAQEENVSHFLLERSTDYQNWEVVEQIPAVGNSNTPSFYSRFDGVSEPAGTYYYRVISVDNDGFTDRSESVALSYKSGAFSIEQVYPNPFGEVLHLDINSPTETTLQLSLVSPTGVEVYRRIESLKADRQLVHLNLSELAAGTYILQATALGETYRWRVLRK